MLTIPNSSSPTPPRARRRSRRSFQRLGSSALSTLCRAKCSLASSRSEGVQELAHALAPPGAPKPTRQIQLHMTHCEGRSSPPNPLAGFSKHHRSRLLLLPKEVYEAIAGCRSRLSDRLISSIITLRRHLVPPPGEPREPVCLIQNRSLQGQNIVFLIENLCRLPQITISYASPRPTSAARASFCSLNRPVSSSRSWRRAFNSLRLTTGTGRFNA